MSNPLFGFSAIGDRKPLALPGDERIAVWLGVNIEHYEFGTPALSLWPEVQTLVPDVINYGWRDYGNRVGVWRLMDELSARGVRGTAMLNSDVCDYYPEIIQRARDLNWGWVAHGKDNSTLQAQLEVEEEREYIESVTETLAGAIGVRPRGWLGPFRSASLTTNDLLSEFGYSHAMDWGNDDQPYLLNTKGDNPLYSVPYSIEVADVAVFVRDGLPGEEFKRRIVDQFDRLHLEGGESARVMGISLHPFLAGQAFRIKYLLEALDYMLDKDRVWWTTSSEIADWMLQGPSRT